MPAARPRLLAAVVAALLSLGLVACQQNDGFEPSTTTEAGEEQPLPGEEDAPDPSPSPDAGDVEDAEG
jgi:hypothetical protein